MKHSSIDSTFSTLVILVVVSVFASYAVSESRHDENEIDGYYSLRPRGRCVSDYDCRKGECSVMGMQRFAEPMCEPLGGLGAPCRMGAEAENKTLHFPHMTMDCQNVYMQFCPCASGLVCQEAECKPSRRPRPRPINRRPNSWARMRGLQQQSSTPQPV